MVHTSMVSEPTHSHLMMGLGLVSPISRGGRRLPAGCFPARQWTVSVGHKPTFALRPESRPSG
jgi:hypothetical protein